MNTFSLHTVMNHRKKWAKQLAQFIFAMHNTFPKEIEDFMYTIPKVQDVQVVGVPDEKYGEEAYAFVILNEGEEATVEEIKEYMSTRIAKHKIPRYIEFVKSFPMNVAGKILKYKMREDAKARIQGIN